MSEVKDYRLTIRVRNNRLLRRIEATRGFVSVPRWCAKHGFSYTAVTDLIAMKASPLRVNGDWRDLVERLASMLRSDPADLFPQRQVEGSIKKTTVEREVSETELLALTEPEALALIEDQTPERDTLDKDLIAKMLAVLPDKDRRMVETYYGVGGGDAAGTLDDLAEEFGISRERIRQRLTRARHKMLTAAWHKFHLISGKQFRELEKILFSEHAQKLAKRVQKEGT